MPAFIIGEVVRATVTTQGLVKGQRYTVCGRDDRETFCGTFITYAVKDDEGTVIWNIGNGHLVMTRDISLDQPVLHPEVRAARRARRARKAA